MDTPGTSIRMRALATCWCLLAGSAGAADAEVQRQLQQRDQQRLELQLRMQQQNERAVQSARPPGAETRVRTLEIEQQQRLRGLHDQQARETIVPKSEPDSASMAAERERAARSGAEELDRMRVQRRDAEMRDRARDTAHGSTLD